MLGGVGMAPVCVTRLCDILCELPEPYGAKGSLCAGNLSTTSGATLCGNP
jgi:hypothetical protein